MLAAGSPPSLFTTKTPSALAPQLQPAQVQRTGEGVEREGAAGGQRKKKRASTAERRDKDEQMMDRADVEKRGKSAAVMRACLG